MKKLNGKCLDAFGDKCAYDYKEFVELPEACQNALIIEFFDSVGIVITINTEINNSANSCEEYCENCDSCYDTWNPVYEYFIYTFSKIENNINDYISYFCEETFETRAEAANEAIIKANILFNEK